MVVVVVVVVVVAFGGSCLFVSLQKFFRVVPRQHKTPTISHGITAHPTPEPKTPDAKTRNTGDLNARNAGTENTGRGNRKHLRIFSLFNARREPKTPSQELKTPAGTEKTEPGTENTAAREPKTHLATKNTAGTENTNAGRKNTAGTKNTNPGTKNREPKICPAQPSAEIVRVECAKCRRECDLDLSGATLCGDRACRVHEMQARVRFGLVRRSPLRRSCVSSARNAGESAIWICPAQPSVELEAENWRVCSTTVVRGAICGAGS